jgi:hypothetical protein
MTTDTRQRLTIEAVSYGGLDGLIAALANAERTWDLAEALKMRREAAEPVSIPVLEPLTCVVQQLDPAVWGNV